MILSVYFVEENLMMYLPLNSTSTFRNSINESVQNRQAREHIWSEDDEKKKLWDLNIEEEVWTCKRFCKRGYHDPQPV